MTPSESGLLAAYSPDYAAARDRFRVAATSAGAVLESHAIEARGPGGMELTVDVARLGPADADRLLIVSSGLHGVEGFFGSAAQLAWLAPAGGRRPPTDRVAVLLLHALDPYGFAWLRRFDEQNVDLNRNFLGNDPGDGEGYSGAPPLYDRLDALINPRHAPRPLGSAFFRLRAILAILRLGQPAIKAAIARGQYDYPFGLFFGGHGPAPARRIVEVNLARWVGAARSILHVDFHTGLGPWGRFCLLTESEITPSLLEWLRATFGVDRVGGADPNGVAYPTRGDIGTWCRSHLADREYDQVCAEFGTYPALQVLAALREENQAHHWLPQGHAGRDRAKRRLSEVFVPADPKWRLTVLVDALLIIEKVRARLAQSPP